MSNHWWVIVGLMYLVWVILPPCLAAITSGEQGPVWGMNGFTSHRSRSLVAQRGAQTDRTDLLCMHTVLMFRPGSRERAWSWTCLKGCSVGPHKNFLYYHALPPPAPTTLVQAVLPHSFRSQTEWSPFPALNKSHSSWPPQLSPPLTEKLLLHSWDWWLSSLGHVLVYVRLNHRMLCAVGPKRVERAFPLLQ